MGKEAGITVKKNDDFSEWYTQVVIKAELADYAPVKGLIVLRPDGYSIWESLKTSLDSKLAATGHRNGFLPVLIPESLLGKEKDHFTGLIQKYSGLHILVMVRLVTDLHYVQPLKHWHIQCMQNGLEVGETFH